MARQLINLGLIAEVVKAVLTVVTKNSDLASENASLKSQLAEAIASEQDLGEKLEVAQTEADEANANAEAASANAANLSASLQQLQSESVAEDTDETATNGAAEAQLTSVLEALLALEAAPVEAPAEPVAEEVSPVLDSTEEPVAEEPSEVAPF